VKAYSSAISRFDNYEAKTGIDIAMSTNQNKLVYFFKCTIVFYLNESKLTSSNKIFDLMKTIGHSESYSSAISSLDNYEAKTGIDIAMSIN
jgi:hypothetical protein